MINENRARNIYRLVSRQLKDASDQEYNETFDILDEMLELYSLKHNKNRKKLFAILVQNEEYDMTDSIHFVLAYDKKLAIAEFCINSSIKQYHISEDQDVIDVEEMIKHQILILKEDN